MKDLVRSTFEDIKKTLDFRENLLIRQIDALASQHHHPYQTRNRAEPIINQINFSTANKEEILNSIRAFGKFNLDEYNIMHDSKTMEESVDESTPINSVLDEEISLDQINETICVDFATNELLIRENVHLLNDSIVNITLNESKELIANVKLGYNNNTVIDQTKETTSSAPEVIEIIERDLLDTKDTEIELNNDDLMNNNNSNNNNIDSVSEQETSEKTIKSKEEIVKAHVCTGVINLKNISNLTINANCYETNDCPCSSPSSIDSIKLSKTSNEDSEKQTTEQRRKQQKYNCAFYSRLINNIKNSLTQNAHKNLPKINDVNEVPLESQSTSANTSLAELNSHLCSNNTFTKEKQVMNENQCNKILFKNIKNLKINIPITTHERLVPSKYKSRNPGAGKDNDNQKKAVHYERPIQIEEWLKQIVSETEIEPVQNLEILEHSQIHNGCM